MTQTKPIITVDGLTKAYAGTPVVDGISFTVKTGEIFGLLGPNGAGKTTTLEMLEALRSIDAGRATIDGIDVAKQPKQIKQIIGIQLQSTTFYDKLTLREQLRMFASLYGRRVDADALLEKVQLSAKAGSYVEQLSGGQKQRFAIAATLVNQPKVLFLDEPTTGLDPQARRNLWELIKTIRDEGITIVLTTHYMDEAELLCDRLAIMDAGKIITIDTPQHLMRVKSYWIGVYGQVRALEKRFMRDGTSLFFTFLFPLIFLLVFGAVFNNQTTSFDVAIINHSKSEFAKQFVEQAKANNDTTLKVKDVKDMQEAREKLKHSELSGIIELPADFGEAKPAQVGAPGQGSGQGQQPDTPQPRQGSATGQTQARPSGTLRVLYAKGSEQSGNTLTAIMGQIIDGINKGMGQPEPPLKVAGQAVGDEQLKTFDYTFTGLLAFSLMSMGIFGLANQMPTEKQKGSYRRLRASPFTAGQLILAVGIHYTIVSLLSAAMMLVVGMTVFHFNMRGDWLLAVPFITLAALLMVGFGLLIGGWAKNENQSAPLGNLVAFPMMFLSGTFFPSFMFPEWLRTLSQFVPMTPVTDGLRLIMAENASLAEVLPYAGAVGLWILVVYIAAIKLFRWE